MNVDNMRENRIIALGQATPSGSGSGGVYGRHSDPSGVQFAFTNRFVAPTGRTRKSVAQLSRNVTNLPKTRRNYVVVPSTRRALRRVAFCFSPFLNSESTRPDYCGAINSENLRTITVTLSSKGEHE
jgi:hypothetical protein